MSSTPSPHPVVEWTLRGPQGREYPLPLREGESLSIGRDLTCEVAVVDAGVSRHHADLSLEHDELWIEDLHSQNGCFVNSTRVTRHRLHEGDIVTLGRVHLTVHREERAIGSTLPGVEGLPQETLARLLVISRGLRGPETTKAEFARALDELAEGLSLESCLALEWNESARRSEFIAGREYGSSVEFVIETLVGKVGLSVFERGIVGVAMDPRTSRRIQGSLLVVPVTHGERPEGFLIASRPREIEPVERSELSAFAWLASASWRSPPEAPNPTKTVVLESARAEALGLALGRAGRPALSSRLGSPSRLLSLLETQITRLRQRLTETHDLDSTDSGDLVESSLAARAIGILSDEAPHRSSKPINLSTAVSESLRTSALAVEPLGFSGDSSIEIDAPKIALRTTVELLASAGRRLFKDPESVTVRTIRGANTSTEEPTAELWFECRDAEIEGGEAWNEQDFALVLARCLASEILDGELLVEPRNARVGLRLPARSLATS